MKPKPLPDVGLSRLAIVDSLASCRIGISNHLAGNDGLEIAWTSSTAEEAYEKLSSDKPDLLIVRNPADRAGRAGIHQKSPPPLSRAQDPGAFLPSRGFYATRCIQAGAMGFFHKAKPMGELIPAILKILSGDVFLSNSCINRAISYLARRSAPTTRSPGDHLTDRELEIIALMAAGDSCQDTADKLRISPRTVQVHRTNIRQKLGLESSSRLHAYAVRFFGDSMICSETPHAVMKSTDAPRIPPDSNAAKNAANSRTIQRHHVKRNPSPKQTPPPPMTTKTPLPVKKSAPVKSKDESRFAITDPLRENHRRIGHPRNG